MASGSTPVNITIDSTTKEGGLGFLHHVKGERSSDDFNIIIIGSTGYAKTNPTWWKDAIDKTNTNNKYCSWLGDRATAEFYDSLDTPHFWMKLNKDLSPNGISHFFEAGFGDTSSFLHEYSGKTYLYFASSPFLKKVPNWADIKKGAKGATNPYATSSSDSPYDTALDQDAARDKRSIKGWLLSSYIMHTDASGTELKYRNEVFVPLQLVGIAGTPVISWLDDKLCLTSSYAGGGSVHYFFDPDTLELVSPHLVVLGPTTKENPDIYLPKGKKITDVYHHTSEHYPMGQLLKVPQASSKESYYLIWGRDDAKLLRVITLDKDWNEALSRPRDLIPGFYPQGAIYDPDENLFYVAYMDKESQISNKYSFRFQNIRLAIFDRSWYLWMDIPVTSFVSPRTPGLSGFTFASGPRVIKDNDDVFVSYYTLEAVYYLADPMKKFPWYGKDYYEDVDTSTVYVRNMKEAIQAKASKPFLGVMPKTVLIPPELQTLVNIPEPDVSLASKDMTLASIGMTAGEQQVIHLGQERIQVLTAESEVNAAIHVGGNSLATTPTGVLSDALGAEPNVEGQAGAVKILSGNGILED
jgi:hypothetical protein